MISDEGQQRAANTMREAAELNLRAANLISDSIHQLTGLIGQGYGTNLDQIIEQLKIYNERRNSSDHD